MDTLVVNFVGAPSSGKTTLAALTYGTLKLKGYSIEYVPEYAKHLVWTKQFELLNNQHYVSKTQYEFLKSVNHQVKIIITDGPLLAGLYYNEYNKDNLSNANMVGTIIEGWMGEFDNMYIMVKRNHPFEEQGRVHSESESTLIHQGFIDLMGRLGIEYDIGSSTTDDVIKIVAKIEARLEVPTRGPTTTEPLPLNH